ncbi:MAG: PKD domain-containing protein [Dermatophilaceae bacterium]
MATPISSFTASSTSGTAPLSVQLTDASTGSPTSWSWNFGDGTTSAVQNPSVSYATAGTYTVTLTASNASGAGTVATQTITVTATTPTPSTAHISSLSTDEGYVGAWVTITGSGFGTPGTVKFGTVIATVSYWSSTRIGVRVPAGISGHEVDVTVIPNGGTASNGVEFELEGSSDAHEAPRHDARLGGDFN